MLPPSLAAMNLSKLLCMLAFGLAAVSAEPYRSVSEFGVSPTNSAAVNSAALQKAIDWASPRGAALFLEASEEP